MPQGGPAEAAALCQEAVEAPFEVRPEALELLRDHLVDRDHDHEARRCTIDGFLGGAPENGEQQARTHQARCEDHRVNVAQPLAARYAHLACLRRWKLFPFGPI